MTNLNQSQTLTYSDFLLALRDDEYTDCINSCQEGQSLYDCVVAYASTNYPIVTIA